MKSIFLLLIIFSTTLTAFASYETSTFHRGQIVINAVSGKKAEILRIDRDQGRVYVRQRVGIHGDQVQIIKTSEVAKDNGCTSDGKTCVGDETVYLVANSQTIEGWHVGGILSNDDVMIGDGPYAKFEKGKYGIKKGCTLRGICTNTWVYVDDETQPRTVRFVFNDPEDHVAVYRYSTLSQNVTRHTYEIVKANRLQKFE